MSPTTVDRLKSLPLTIVLTILIWMYAEAKFTATGETRITIRPVAPTPDLVVRVQDPVENRYLPTISVAVTLQGPTNQIGFVQQDTNNALTFTPGAAELKYGTDNRVDTAATLNNLDYFRKHGLTVTSANPARLHLEVDKLEQIAKSVDFHSPIPVDNVLQSTEHVTVLIPSTTLQDIGGAGKLSVVAIPSRELATLPVGSQQIVPVRYVPEYNGVHDDRITVTPAQGTVTLTIPRREAITQAVPDVPVWISGPPALLARYSVDVRPKFIKATVAGTDAAIRALQERLATASRGAGGGDQGVHAFLDISLDDRPTDTPQKRRVRYSLPEGLTLQDTPAEVEFRLIEPAATRPVSTQGASEQ